MKLAWKSVEVWRHFCAVSDKLFELKYAQHIHVCSFCVNLRFLLRKRIEEWIETRQHARQQTCVSSETWSCDILGSLNLGIVVRDSHKAGLCGDKAATCTTIFLPSLSFCGLGSINFTRLFCSIDQPSFQADDSFAKRSPLRIKETALQKVLVRTENHPHRSWQQCARKLCTIIFIIEKDDFSCNWVLVELANKLGYIKNVAVI